MSAVHRCFKMLSSMAVWRCVRDPLLVHHFAMHYGARMHKRITAISEEFMEAVVRHSWPGNVRELQNLIERSVILSNGAVLGGLLSKLDLTTPDTSRWSTRSTPVTLLEGQISHILQTLEETKGVPARRLALRPIDRQA